MITKIGTWGGSSAVRLPKSLVEDLGLKPGDAMDVRLEGDRLIMRPMQAPLSPKDLAAAAKTQERPDHVWDNEAWGNEAL